MTIDTKLPASDPLRFRKNLFDSYKNDSNEITDQIKIIMKKIMQNKAQYDFDRKAARISALFSNNLDKYEYLTAEDLGLKPSTIEQTKFEYFNKGFDKDDQKWGLFKRLKNIKNAQKS